jgi:lipopolysaccharide/colanic/teichoic acid biosynthesis glycosyltransferase
MSVAAKLGAWPSVGAPRLIAACAAASAAAAATVALIIGLRKVCPPVRLAVVGSAPVAAEMAARLARQRPRRYEVVGYVSDVSDGRETPHGRARLLGTIARLPHVIASHGLELLVLSPGVSRPQYYDGLVSNGLVPSIRTADLDHFYERAFGHVPVGSINSCWFHHLVTMDRGRELRALRRAVDLIFVAVLGTLTLPLLAVLVLLIRRDGGPALFRQVRVGEGGRPFVILKLRTMRVQDEDEARWTAEHDPRITGLGRILRATHLDELPQLVNVVRGEMNIVGPRPEQPALVDRLEALVPYYQRRHLVKPGVAGWAQARCGYGGSDDGSLRKVCHDLYYLRHRSIRFDLAILAETFFAMFRHDAGVGVVSQQAERLLSRGCHPLEHTDLLPQAGTPKA